MPTPLGPVIKAWLSTCGRGGLPHHLPGVVDARGVTGTSTQRPEIGQSFAIGVYDVCMLPVRRQGKQNQARYSGLRPESSFGF